MNEIKEALKKVMGKHSDYFRELRALDAVYHLFRVASGLDSAILGENEVLRQVKEAWIYAKNNSYLDEILDIIFQRAIAAGRRVRRETNISKGAIGYPAASVLLASNILKGLEDKQILIVGTGFAATKIVNILVSKFKPKRLLVAGRSVGRARKLANMIRDIDVDIMSLNEIEKINNIDVAFIALKGEIRLNDLINKSKIIIDISLPPKVPFVKGKTYFVKDVETIVRSSLDKRLREVPKAERIIAEEIERLKKLLRTKSVDNIISSIMETANYIMMDEIKRTSKKLMNCNNVEEHLKIMCWSYTKKIFRPLILSLRDLALSGEFDVLNDVYNQFMFLRSKLCGDVKSDGKFKGSEAKA